MIEANYDQKKKYKELRHELARAGFGSNIYKKGREFVLQVRAVKEHGHKLKEIKLTFKLTGYKNNDLFKFVQKIKTQIKDHEKKT